MILPGLGSSGSRLTLLHVPTGYKKTTLLGAWWIARGTHRVAWLSLDRVDNDPKRRTGGPAAAGLVTDR